MLRSFRARLIATVIALIAVTAGFMAVLSFVLVRNSLRGQLVDDAVARAEFNITVLATTEHLPADAGRQAFEASGLADRFLLRGTGGVYVEFTDGEPFSSSLSLLGANESFSSEFRRIVGQAEFGYEFLTVDEVPTLVVGGRRPPLGPDFYFFFSAVDVENAISQLARVLVIAGVAILVLGALGAGLIARRVLRPVAVASKAAGLMAAGDLTVRLPADTGDELGRLADAFNQMAASLQHQIEALVAAHDRERRFVGDVSHELRTPLTALVNEAAMLQGHLDKLPDTERRVGEMLIADVSRLRTLVEDLLEISRLDSAPTAPDSTDIDLGLFLEAVIADRYPGAELRLSDSVGSVRTDGRSLERIVGNLLDNGRHHAPDAPIAVDAAVEAGEIRIEVADAGPGVHADELPHLFDRFYKADTSRRGGSGLGLAIARQHARRLSGDLIARPGKRRGLVFELRVPVTEPLHSRDAAEKLPSQPEGEPTNHTRSES
ncbi:MAG: HAMP domain-containing sensor histidine kinase [Actinomycetota bacterium]|nr:HAMP domain-containing sensor histidine kinase [Actinomycetota bacterium]